MLIIHDILQIHTALNPVIKPGICRAHSYSIRVEEKNHLWKEQWLTFWKRLFACFLYLGRNLIAVSLESDLCELFALLGTTKEGVFLTIGAWHRWRWNDSSASHSSTSLYNNEKSKRAEVLDFLWLGWPASVPAHNLKYIVKISHSGTCYRKPEWRHELEQFTQWRCAYWGSHT